jgi:hypothetical protein
MAASAVSRTREEIEEQDQFFIAMRRQCGHRGALHRLEQRRDALIDHGFRSLVRMPS